AWVGLPKDEDLVETVEADPVAALPAGTIEGSQPIEVDAGQPVTEPIPIDTTAELLGRRTRKPRARAQRATPAPAAVKRTAAKKPPARKTTRAKKAVAGDESGGGE